MSKNPVTPFTIVDQVRGGNYNGSHHASGKIRAPRSIQRGPSEERDLLIQDWIQGLSKEDYTTLENLATEFVENLRKRKRGNGTLIGVKSAMAFLVLLALHDV